MSETQTITNIDQIDNEEFSLINFILRFQNEDKTHWLTVVGSDNKQTWLSASQNVIYSDENGPVYEGVCAAVANAISTKMYGTFNDLLIAFAPSKEDVTEEIRAQMNDLINSTNLDLSLDYESRDDEDYEGDVRGVNYMEDLSEDEQNIVNQYNSLLLKLDSYSNYDNNEIMKMEAFIKNSSTFICSKDVQGNQSIIYVIIDINISDDDIVPHNFDEEELDIYSPESNFELAILTLTDTFLKNYISLNKGNEKQNENKAIFFPSSEELTELIRSRIYDKKSSSDSVKVVSNVNVSDNVSILYNDFSNTNGNMIKNYTYYPLLNPDFAISFSSMLENLSAFLDISEY